MNNKHKVKKGQIVLSALFFITALGAPSLLCVPLVFAAATNPSHGLYLYDLFSMNVFHAESQKFAANTPHIVSDVPALPSPVEKKNVSKRRINKKNHTGKHNRQLCSYCRSKNKPKKGRIARSSYKKAWHHEVRGPACSKKFSWPIEKDKFWISSFFGMRRSHGHIHTGIDMAAFKGTPVYAAEAGTVETATAAGSYGKMVLIRHDATHKSRYAHLHKIATWTGKKVHKGELLGFVGNSGRTRGENGGYHLHFEILVHNRPTNPIRCMI